jgi:hypothetical protein
MFPKIDQAARLKQIQTDYEQTEAAKSIVIVGGGAVGIEWAAFIKEQWGDKQVRAGMGETVARLCACVCVYVCVHACVFFFVCLCVRARAYV